MNNYLTDSSTRTGTVGGTLLVLIMQINGSQILNTALTAGTGAAVSFAVAITCRYIANWMEKRRDAMKKAVSKKKKPFKPPVEIK